MSRFIDAQAAADRAQQAWEEAQEEGLSARVIAELREELEEAKAYAERGVFEEINAEQLAKAQERKRLYRQERRRRDRGGYYKRQDPSSHQPMHAALDGDCLTISAKPFRGSVKERPPTWFRALMPRRSRTRRHKSRGGHRGRTSRRRGSRSSRGSPDDPGEPEPELGLQGLINCGIPLYLLVLPAERERHDG